MLYRCQVLGLALALTACQEAPLVDRPKVETAPRESAPAPAKAPAVDGVKLAQTWRSETIPLPSGFAKGLPKGVEELRFAPGMYDAKAADYWSYVFVLRFEQKLEGRAGLQSALDQYYTGLITAVAKSRNVAVDGAAATVSLTEQGNGRFAAQVDLVDAFVTGKRLRVQMELGVQDRGNGTAVSAAVSPQPKTHAVWRSLRAVLGAIQ